MGNLAAQKTSRGDQNFVIHRDWDGSLCIDAVTFLSVLRADVARQVHWNYSPCGNYASRCRRVGRDCLRRWNSGGLISGGPAWTDSDLYNILAATPGDDRPSVDEQMLMARKLLEDRFNLAFHREKKELPVYVLTVVRTGSKLKEGRVRDLRRIENQNRCR